MAFFLTTLLRRFWIKKYSSDRRTGLIPLKSVRSVLAVLDGEDPECVACAGKLTAFFKARNIDISLLFIDFRKRNKDVTVYADGENVLLRKDVNCWGLPAMKKKGYLFLQDTDILINLRDSCDFTGDFISKASKAGFKIGTCSYDGNPFDLIITGKEGNFPEGEMSQKDEKHIPERIDTICSFLNQII